jgi:hypothetical protein
MNIHDLSDFLLEKVHNHELENGELIADCPVTLPMGVVKDIADVLAKQIEVNRRRAAAGGRGPMTEVRQASLARARGKAAESRIRRRAAKEDATS